MKFSEREGFVPIRQVLGKEEMPPRLRNRLWNALSPTFEELDVWDGNRLYRSLWGDFAGESLDKIPTTIHDYVPEEGLCLIAKRQVASGQDVRDYLQKKCCAEWYLTYDFLEFLYSYLEESHSFDISELINPVLEQEKSPYRMIDGKFVSLTSEQEIEAIESALQIQDKYTNAKTHLQNAISSYADRKNPDYGNSIKESIHAVEAVAKVVVGNDNDSFGKLLGKLKGDHNLPDSLKHALTHLYGYTSNEAGIRHPLQDGQTPPTENNTRFMLVICSAFVNYIIGKIET